MHTLATLLVCTVKASDTVTVGACWDGGSSIAIHITVAGRTVRATSWPIWNDAWDSPLIETTRESFERFVVGRLEEPGVVDELVGMAAA